MTAQIHPAYAALAQRWTTFLDKVRARVQEIDGEASAGYAEVIAADAIDGTGLSGVSSALKARLLALAQKVDESWEKISSEADSVDVDDGRAGGYFQGVQLALKAQFSRWLERETERMITKGEADAGRALHAVALVEVGQQVPCTHCGTPLDRPLWHMAINVTCPSCKAVSTLTPGTASAMFTGGAGAHWLAKEQAFGAWCAMQEAEVAWHKLRHKTMDDLARWEGANRQYWQVYADAMGRLHPGWTPKHVADEVTGKMSWFLQTTATDDRTVRENNHAGISAIAAGDPNAVVAWVKRQRDPEDAGETLIQAAIERGWGQHATWIAQLVGPIVAADEPGWAAEKVDELMYYQATRGD